MKGSFVVKFLKVVVLPGKSEVAWQKQAGTGEQPSN